MCFRDFSSSVTDFDDALSSASIPSSLIDDLNNDNTAFEAIRTYVGQAISDVTQLGNGYCQSAPQKQCTGGLSDPGDCGTCIGFGSQR